jgi:hypothetical protein
LNRKVNLFKNKNDEIKGKDILEEKEKEKGIINSKLNKLKLIK